MSSIVISGDTSGAITLAAPAVSGTNTATLPAATGTVMVSGNMPAFSAYQSTLQSVTGNAYTKVQLQTEEFDTANAFDSTTNYRFTPQIAGYYQIQGGCYINQFVLTGIYKNGSEYKRGVQSSTNGALTLGTVSSIVYLNGSTDYVELWVYCSSTQNTSTGIAVTYFNGSLIRGA